MTRSNVRPRLLTSVQVGALLGLSWRTIVRMVERGDLEYVQRFGDGPKAPYAFDLEYIQQKAAERLLSKDRTATLDLDLENQQRKAG